MLAFGIISTLAMVAVTSALVNTLTIHNITVVLK
jgi:hypothetical protein